MEKTLAAVAAYEASQRRKEFFVMCAISLTGIAALINMMVQA